jgi:hypothetical protein
VQRTTEPWAPPAPPCALPWWTATDKGHRAGWDDVRHGECTRTSTRIVGHVGGECIETDVIVQHRDARDADAVFETMTQVVLDDALGNHRTIEQTA